LRGCRFAIRIRQVADQPDAVSVRGLERACEALRPLSLADEKHETLAAELTADPSHHGPGVEAEEAEEGPTKDREHADESAAEIEAQRELDEDEPDDAEEALLETIAEDFARKRRVQPFINLQPIADGGP